MQGLKSAILALFQKSADGLNCPCPVSPSTALSKTYRPSQLLCYSHKIAIREKLKPHPKYHHNHYRQGPFLMGKKIVLHGQKLFDQLTLHWYAHWTLSTGKILCMEMVFCFHNCSELLWEKKIVIEKNFWNLRLKAENLQFFVITGTIYSNSERSVQFFEQHAVFNLLLEIS